MLPPFWTQTLSPSHLKKKLSIPTQKKNSLLGPPKEWGFEKSIQGATQIIIIIVLLWLDRNYSNVVRLRSNHYHSSFFNPSFNFNLIKFACEEGQATKVTKVTKIPKLKFLSHLLSSFFNTTFNLNLITIAFEGASNQGYQIQQNILVLSPLLSSFFNTSFNFNLITFACEGQPKQNYQGYQIGPKSLVFVPFYFLSSSTHLSISNLIAFSFVGGKNPRLPNSKRISFCPTHG